MSLHDIARDALEEIKAIEGTGVTDGHEAELLKVIDRAMHRAMDVCCSQHAEIVEEHLSHATGVAERINLDSEKQRMLLMSNLTAMR